MRWLQWSYNENETQQQISKVLTIERAHLLNQKKQAISNRIPLTVTFQRTLPGIKRAVNKHWDILQKTSDFEEAFPKPSIIPFPPNKNLQDILCRKTNVNNKKQKCQNIDQNRYSKPCNSKLNSICPSAINKQFQKYSHTKNLQSTQQTELQKQIPNTPNGMYVMQQTIHR